MKKLSSIENFKEGNSIQGFYLCVQKHIRHTRSGDLYLDLELRDISGHISGKIWDTVSELNEKFEAGDAVVVSGDVESFMDRPQLVVRKINKATVQHYSRYGFDPAHIVPTSKKDPIKMWNEIEDIINGNLDQEDNPLTNAPHTAQVVTNDNWAHSYSRNQAAYPAKWLKEFKYWPSVGRVDNAFGDRNLICTCPTIEDYENE